MEKFGFSRNFNFKQNRDFHEKNNKGFVFAGKELIKSKFGKTNHFGYLGPK